MSREKRIKQPVTKGAAKVPVIMQLEALECGAACLAMVMAYYEKWVPLEQVRVDCGVSRDGSNAKNIVKAAKNYGFKSRGFKYEVETLRKKGSFPCIIHWNFNHFVVLDGFKGGKAIINDPARGTVRIPMDEFGRSFTGICLHIEPDEGFVPEGKKKSTFTFARKRLRGAGTAVVFVSLISLIAYLFNVINPVMSQVFVDKLLYQKQSGMLYPFIGVMSGLAALQIIVEWIRAVYTLKINGKLAIIGSSGFMWKVLRMPMEFFTQRLAGDIQQRQSTNASIASTLVNTLAPLALNTLMMIFYLVVMIRHSLLLTAVGVAAILINLLMSNIISKKRFIFNQI